MIYLIILFLFTQTYTDDNSSVSFSGENDIKSFSIKSHALVGEIDKMKKLFKGN